MHKKTYFNALPAYRLEFTNSNFAYILKKKKITQQKKIPTTYASIKDKFQSNSC